MRAAASNDDLPEDSLATVLKNRKEQYLSNRKHRSAKRVSSRSSTGSISPVSSVSTDSRIACSIQMKIDQTIVLKHKNQLELCKILLQCRDTCVAQCNHCIESAISNVLPTVRNINETLAQQINEEDFATIGE